MIPIRDTIPSRHYPVTNTVLIIVNVIFYMVEMSQGESLQRFIFTYGLVPGRYSIPEIAAYFTPFAQLIPFLSFMFLHGSFWHLLGNMWFLYIFGDNIEDRLGPVRYLLFYLLCGLASGLAHMFFNLASLIPTVGASGAIAGVMGAYFILYPKSKIITLIPILFIPYFIEVPAAIFLGVWLFIQFISATLSGPESAGIAWWAHIGGFIFGVVFLKMFLLIPEWDISRTLSQASTRKGSPHLQITKPDPVTDELDLYGAISVTPEEASRGTRKLISIPFEYQKKPVIVHIPAGIRDGMKLRLAGLGKKGDHDRRGDFYLTVKVTNH